MYAVVKKGERLQEENNKGKLYLSVSGGCGSSARDVSVVVAGRSVPPMSSGFLGRLFSLSPDDSVSVVVASGSTVGVSRSPELSVLADAS